LRRRLADLVSALETHSVYAAVVMRQRGRNGPRRGRSRCQRR
jgi:hypothetical protein